MGEHAAHPHPAPAAAPTPPPPPPSNPPRPRRTPRWTLLLAAAVLAPIAVLGAGSYHVAAKAIRDAVDRSNASAAEMAGELVRRDLERGVQIAQTAARLPALLDAVARRDE